MVHSVYGQALPSFFAHFFQSVWAVCTITISLSSPPTQPVRSFLLTEEDATFVSIRFIEKIISRMWQKAKKRKLEVDPIVLQPWLQNFVENKGYSYAFHCGSWIYFLLCWNFTKVTHVSSVFVGNLNKFGIPNAWVARKTHVTWGNIKVIYFQVCCNFLCYNTLKSTSGRIKSAQWPTELT